jgi:hypothetical protein
MKDINIRPETLKVLRRKNTSRSRCSQDSNSSENEQELRNGTQIKKAFVHQRK